MRNETNETKKTKRTKETKGAKEPNATNQPNKPPAADPTPRLDAHHHLWDTGTGTDTATATDSSTATDSAATTTHTYPWMDGPWADPLRGRFGPAELTVATGPGAATIAVQARTDTHETRELLAIAADPRTPVVAVVGWVDLTRPDVADQIAELRSAPGGRHLVGVRHFVQDEPDPRWLLRPDVERSLAALTTAGLTYDLLVKPAQLPAAIEVAQRHPELSFVLDHLGKPEIGAGTWQPWADTIARLAALPNVSVKLSGLVTEADWRHWTIDRLLPYGRHALARFGANRTMFGSDWPVCTLAASYDTVVSVADRVCAELSAAERAHVFGATARRVYGC
ncbi:amidohydrolase family protein [Embleya sp. AB8]|uniref:amidohydrolase family protein n=1 Tax=Embleya sp. AB8 TaxID=3156304 RepID=UPI003C750056